MGDFNALQKSPINFNLNAHYLFSGKSSGPLWSATWLKRDHPETPANVFAHQKRSDSARAFGQAERFCSELVVVLALQSANFELQTMHEDRTLQV